MTERNTKSTEILLFDAATGGGANRLSCASPTVPIGLDLGSQFAATASRCCDLPALTTSAGTSTYRDLLIAAMTVSSRLRRRSSFQPGSRVAVLLPNSLEYIAAFYGILLAGGVVVPLAPKTERRQLRTILDSTSAIQVITQSRFTRSWIDELHEPLLENVSLEEADFAPVPPFTESRLKADSLAAILFTGGSSGTPKGVMLSHLNLIENSSSIQQYLNIQPDERPLCVLPFYHAFGNSVLQSHLLAGCHLIIDGNATFPETLIDAIHVHQATSLSGVPDLFRFLLERTSLETLKNSSLRYMAVAGGVLPHETANQVAERIDPAKFFVMYGQTEATARLAFVPPDRFAELGSGCIGRAVPGVELQVVDESGNQVAPGIVGEIRARGPNVMLGYWLDTTLTNETIRDGWLYTGDLGSVTSDGWFYHHGRRNALIKIAGYRMHPSDVEDFVLRELPVQHVVLVPYEQLGSGTRLALFVRVRPEAKHLTNLEIIACCRQQLPRHMVPDLVQFLDEFPLNDAMKIDRPRLVTWATTTAAQRRTAV